MATKPIIDLPEFANDAASDAGTVEPTQAKKDIGWLVGEKPARETFNWLHRSVYRWLVWCELSIDELVASKVPAGYLAGFQIANNPTDLNNDINFNEGVASATSTFKAIDNMGTGYSNKYLNVAWAEGKNQGGLGNGLTKTADTWYRCFVISKTDGTVDYGFDTSATATNLLASATTYSYYRQVGWILTNSSNQITQFNQVNDDFWLKDYQNVGTHFASTTAQTQEVIAPPDIQAQAHLVITGRGYSSNGNSYWRIASTRSGDYSVDDDNANIDVRGHNETTLASNTSLLIPSDASSLVQFRSDNSTEHRDITFRCLGWNDARGKG